MFLLRTKKGERDNVLMVSFFSMPRTVYVEIKELKIYMLVDEIYSHIDWILFIFCTCYCDYKTLCVICGDQIFVVGDEKRIEKGFEFKIRNLNN